MAALLTLAAVAAGAPRRATGGEHQVTPSAEVREEYNSNVFMASRDRLTSFVTHLAPGVEVARRNERLDAALSGRLDWIQYAGHRGLDSLDQFYQGRARYGLTPLLNVSAGAGYSRDSQPDRDLRTTGLVDLGGDRIIARSHQAYSLAGDAALTEKTSGSLSWSFNKDLYADPRLIGTYAHGVQLGVNHDLQQLLENTRAKANVGYTGTHSVGANVENYTATIGLDRAFKETWSVNGDIGWRFTRAQGNSQGWIGRVTFVRRGETDSEQLSFVRELSTASGRASTTLRNAVTMMLTREFTDRISGNIYAGFYRNMADRNHSAAPPLNETTVEVNPGVACMLSKDLSLGASYSYARVKSDQPSTSVTAHRNTFFVRIIAQHKLFD